jgi:hypothetical protein
MQLDISNVITVSVSQAGAGAGQYNTSNIALFTRDAHQLSFGSDGYKIYKSPGDVATDFGTSSATYKMAVQVFSQKPNILAGNGYLVIIPMLTVPSAETLDSAITRTAGLVQYFGVMMSEVASQVDMLAAAAVIQTLNKMAFFVSFTATDVDSGGMLDLLRTGSFSQSRGLLYIGTLTLALQFMASYASRALSTDFSGSDTTQNIHLKDLVGVLPDPAMTQTILTKCLTAGVDTYISIQGVSKVMASGANKFFDQVYNLQWFAGALQIAAFNVLAQTSTKIPQTESGMDAYKSAIRQVCKQAVNNQYAAPGVWTDPTTFGVQADFLDNISQKGYYIYSIPVSQQLAADRAARKAPLVQVALKEAGAIDTGNILVSVNA